MEQRQKHAADIASGIHPSFDLAINQINLMLFIQVKRQVQHVVV